MTAVAEIDILAHESYECLRNFAQGYGFWIQSSTSRGERKWWPSAEHYFQAGKFLEPALQEQVRRALDPGVAKHLGRTLGPLRADWDGVKRGRLREALVEKFWAHKAPRELLSSIPRASRIVFGSPADAFFGTGPRGEGLNVMGEELMSLRDFFNDHPKRLQVPVTVADVGEPFEPSSVCADLTGVGPEEAAVRLSAALGVARAAVAQVTFVYEYGFERMELDDFQSTSELQEFLAKNVLDCKAEVRLVDTACVTLWDETDDKYLARTEVRHLCPTAARLRDRLEGLLPLLQHADFGPAFTYSIDGGPSQPLDETAMEEICKAATDEADVLICGQYAIPEQVLARAVPQSDPPRVILGVHTDLSARRLRDKVRGLVWGCALGDAVGLGTEFMKKAEAAEAYPDAKKLSPTGRVEDKHRKRWAQGDWTDDTDQLVLLLDALVAGHGVLHQDVFAKALKTWSESGFPELGDSSGLGIGQTVKSVLEHPAFDVAPGVAADVVWRESGCCMAANGAVMRCAAAGLCCFWDEAVVRHNATASAAVTHADPRCLTSCACVALLVSNLLSGYTATTHTQRRDLLLSVALQASSHLDGGDLDELFQHLDLKADGLAGLELGSGGIGYTYKPLGAAAWGFLHAESFKDAIQAIVMEAGDADSNAAVAGALLGVHLGYDKLPRDWIEEVPAKQVAWLNTKIASCLSMMGLE